MLKTKKTKGMTIKGIKPIKQYTIRCQKCGEKLRLEIRLYKTVQTKNRASSKEINTRLEPFPYIFRYSINTRQDKDLMIPSISISSLLDYWWGKEKKKLVRRVYGYMNMKFKGRGILCDKCLQIEALKE